MRFIEGIYAAYSARKRRSWGPIPEKNRCRVTALARPGLFHVKPTRVGLIYTLPFGLPAGHCYR
jgi:hypothetical protein